MNDLSAPMQPPAPPIDPRSPLHRFSPGEAVLLSAFVEAARGVPDADAIERILVFGSRARREGHEESDLDVAIFLSPEADQSVHRRLSRGLTEIAADVQDGWEDLPVLRIVLIGDTPHRTRPALVRDIEQDGIELWAKKNA